MREALFPLHTDLDPFTHFCTKIAVFTRDVSFVSLLPSH